MESKTTDRQELRRRRRKRAKRIRIMKLIALAVSFVVMLVLLATLVIQLYKRWNARFDSETSVIFIQESGQIVTNDVILFDTNKYSQSELEAFVSDTLTTYNKENGEKSVVQKSLKVEDGVASLILIYKDVATYCDFTGAELFIGTINEAVAAGYTFEGRFAAVEDGALTECRHEEIIRQTDMTVAIIKANTRISVQGEIRYVTTENLLEVGENWIVTAEGANLLPDTESESSQTDTESETSDGTVDGTESEPEEETSTEIIFDFGDGEVDNTEESYSEVYTYIIFK